MVKRKQSRNGYILQNQSKPKQNGLQKSLMILSIKIPGTKPGIFLETFQKSPDDQFFSSYKNLINRLFCCVIQSMT